MRFLLALLVLTLGVSSLQAEYNVSQKIEMRSGVPYYDNKPIGLIGNEFPTNISFEGRALRNMSDVLDQNYYTSFELLGQDTPLINGTYRDINGTLVNLNSTFDFINDTHVNIENQIWDLKTIFPKLPEVLNESLTGNETQVDSLPGNETQVAVGPRCLFFRWPIFKRKRYRRRRRCRCECCRRPRPPPPRPCRRTTRRPRPPPPRPPPPPP
ncbi:hypothetical protein WDU94_003079, partial [Cyamophila willieti]